uniref:Hydroxymethylglutaryl-coenzyme A synthase C-terminal domain-containing protein n=1 Tax=Timema shepardi TaxID=629360 RepID=A0A7R9B0P4_TIMSH|nr:unnamed protein product [Timema shepardi]
MATWPKDVGIVALELLVPSLYVDQAQLEEFDGVSAGKYTIGFGQSKMGFCTDREDIISLCLTVVSKLMARYNIDYSNIGRLEVGTETIVDKSKSKAQKAIQVDGGKEAIRLKHLDAMLFHSPYCKLVQKSLARLVLNDYVLTSKNELAAKFPGLENFAEVKLEDTYFDRDVEKAFMTFSKGDFEKKTKPSLFIANQVGNMYTPSLYGGLVSLLVCESASGLAGKRVGLFSYGSGLASSLYSLRISKDASKGSALDKLLSGLSYVKPMLEARKAVDPLEFSQIMEVREKNHHKAPYTPQSSPDTLFPGTWYLDYIDDKHRRFYQRIPLAEQPQIQRLAL